MEREVHRMLIKRMTVRNIEEVKNMMREFYASAAVLTNGSEEIFDRNIKSCVGDDPCLEGYIFEEDSLLIGYSMLAKSFSTEYGRHCIWIEDLYFKPEYRRKGFGSQFFSFLEVRYPGTLFRLEAEKSNEAAIRAYLKNGFEILPYVEMKK